MLTSNCVTIVLFSLAACLPGTRIGAFEGTDGARGLIYNLNGIANSKLRPDPQRALAPACAACTMSSG